MSIAQEYKLGFIAGFNFNTDSAFDNDRLQEYLKPEHFCDTASTLAYKQGFLRGYFGDMYKPPFTTNQILAVAHLHKKNLFYAASKCLQHWYNGQQYTINANAETLHMLKLANKDTCKSRW